MPRLNREKKQAKNFLFTNTPNPMVLTLNLSAADSQAIHELMGGTLCSVGLSNEYTLIAQLRYQ